MPELKIYDIETIREELNKFTNYEDKVLYLINFKADWEQYVVQKNADYDLLPEDWKEKSQLNDSYEKTFIRQLDIEIERLKALAKIKRKSINKPATEIIQQIPNNLDNKSYLNWTLLNFLDVITYKEPVYDITFKFENSVDEPILISGSKTELKFIVNLTGDLDSFTEADKKRVISMQQYVNDLPDHICETELSQIEIYNYLENITGKFDILKTKQTLDDVLQYACLDLTERLILKSRIVYDLNKWEYPITKSTGIDKGEKTEINVCNDKEMINRVFPYAFFNINHVENILKSKLNSNNSTGTQSQLDSNSNIGQTQYKIISKHPLIFTNDGYKLFIHLVDNYIGEDKTKAKAKYSEIFHYLKEYQSFDKKLILCTQLDFIAFLKSEYNISLSRIQRKTTEYDDTIKHKLRQLHKTIFN